MKMLFFSSDDAEVEQVSQEFVHAGIPCEVRGRAFPESPARDAEVWIERDEDSHRAFMVCVERGIGFAKRPHQLVEDDVDW